MVCSEGVWEGVRGRCEGRRVMGDRDGDWLNKRLSLTPVPSVPLNTLHVHVARPDSIIQHYYTQSKNHHS